MAGVTLEFDNAAALAAIQAAADAMGDPEPMLHDMGQYLLASTEDRFKSQSAPDGSAWQALSPRYQRSKKKNRDKILTLDGYLGGHLAFQVNGSELLVGSNRKYAAIHQFGGEIQQQAREREVFFKQDQRSGEIGNRFVKKAKSNFAQRVQIGAYSIRIPARPFLGTSSQDDDELLQLAQDFLSQALSDGAA
jgi:phage virion morphogenesis protein